MSTIKIATADIEANDWIKFLMLGFYDGYDYKIFFSIKKFLEYILRNKNYNNYRIYFHNGGRYDFLFLIEQLLDLGYPEFIGNENGFIAIKFTSKEGTRITFVDSYKLLPSSLDSLIKTFNIKETKIDIDFSKEYKRTNKRLQQHLMHDCISLYKILIKFYELEGFLSYTIASHALRIFTSKYFFGEIWNANSKFDFYFRKNFYKGGRVEVYKGTGKNLFYYDYNSLYPSVMLNEMPCGDLRKTSKEIKNKIGFYKVKLLKKVESYISILSYKNNKGSFYVNGNKGEEFYLMSNELDYLKEKNISYKIIDGYYFNESDFLFNDYVKEFYYKKEHAKDNIERLFAKLMLNSLYGKFGQKLTGENIELFNGTQKGFKIFDAYNDLILVDKERNLKFKGVYLASYITSLARVKHLRMMDTFGFENIYYCDTDSIITNKKIKDSTELGELKIVDKIKEGIFLLPKTYGYINDKKEEVTKYKGFSGGSFSYTELKKLINNEVTELKEIGTRILGFKESIRRKNNIKLNKGTYLKLCNYEKILKMNYKRRRIIASSKYKFDTKPFYINELAD